MMHAQRVMRRMRGGIFLFLALGSGFAYAISLADYDTLWQRASDAFDAVDQAAPNDQKLTAYINVVRQLARLEGDAQAQAAIRIKQPDWLVRNSDLQTRVQAAMEALLVCDATRAGSIEDLTRDRDALQVQNHGLHGDLDAAQARVHELEAQLQAVSDAIAHDLVSARDQTAYLNAQAAALNEQIAAADKVLKKAGK